MNTFQEKLSEGQKCERAFYNQMLNPNGHKLIKYNDDERYDIKTSYVNKAGHQVVATTEVKKDDKSIYTGNFYIECFAPKRGQRSGIEATKADWFVIMVPSGNKGYVFKTKELRQFLAMHCQDETTTTKIIRGGEDFNTEGYLINCECLLHNVKHKQFNFDMSDLVRCDVYSYDKEAKLEKEKRELEEYLDNYLKNNEPDEEELPF